MIEIEIKPEKVNVLFVRNYYYRGIKISKKHIDKKRPYVGKLS